MELTTEQVKSVFLRDNLLGSTPTMEAAWNNWFDGLKVQYGETGRLLAALDALVPTQERNELHAEVEKARHEGWHEGNAVAFTPCPYCPESGAVSDE